MLLGVLISLAVELTVEPVFPVILLSVFLMDPVIVKDFIPVGKPDDNPSLIACALYRPAPPGIFPAIGVPVSPAAQVARIT